MFQLRDYQQQAVNSVIDQWAKGTRSTLLVMATGTGKTVVFAEIIRKWSATHPGRRVLVMAHRKVLVDQAKAKMRDMRNVEVTTVQAASRRVSKTKPDAYGLIVIDEAHHSLAKSYRTVIDHYASAKVLGVTATPERCDGADMGAVFQSVAFTYDMANAIHDGYLSKVKICKAPLQVNLANVHSRQGDYDAAELANAVEPLLDSAAKWIKANAAERHVVVFLPLVDTAKKMAEACKRHGIKAEEIDGESSGKDAALKRFEHGETQVLCNAALLTEGWDAPICDCVMVLRPTQSRALYVQMVGRGTRLHPGKTDVLVPDVLALNARHDVMRPADVLLSDHDATMDVMSAATEKPKTVDELERDVVAQREAALVNAIHDARESKPTPVVQPRRPRGTVRKVGSVAKRVLVTTAKLAYCFIGGFVSGFLNIDIKVPNFEF